MVTITELHKSFGKLEVLRGINESIQAGESVAILGPNGSGKSTLIKCILGLVLPQKGEIKVKDVPIRNQHSYRKHIGYLPQIAHFPDNMKVKNLIEMITYMRGTASSSEELIDYFEVRSFLNKPLRSLSGGTRQKINAILALMFDCDLYIYDEPTVGLDPISRVLFKNHIQKQKEAGKTIILTTHLLNEVEELADRIIFLLDGKVYYNRSVTELIRKYQENSLERAIVKMLREHENNNTHV